MLGKAIATALLVGSAVSPMYAVTPSDGTLIAPMIEGNGLCLSGINNPDLKDLEAIRLYCEEIDESSVSLLESTLSKIGAKNSPDGHFEMGYMLGLSLLSYVSWDGENFSVSHETIRKSLRLVRDSDRDVVLFFLPIISLVLIVQHWQSKFPIRAMS